MDDQPINDYCTSCGRRFELDQLFCSRCGAARAGGVKQEAAPDAISEGHTIRRDALEVVAESSSAAPQVSEEETVLDVEAASEVSAPTLVESAGLLAPVAPSPPSPPTASPYGGPAAGGAVPGVIRLLAGALIAVAALLLYPVFRWGGSILGGLFHGGLFGFSFAMLALYVLVILAMMGAALVALAIGLWRGSRVSQGITIILAGSIGLGELVQAPSNAGGSGQPAAVTYLIVLGCAVIVVALLVPTQVRQFLAAHDDGPLGVGIARTICVYFGWVLAVDGVLIMMIGAVGRKYVFWGIAFFAVAALLLWSQVLLLKVRQSGAVLATATLASYIVVQLSFMKSEHASTDASTVIGILVALCAIGALWLPESSRDFYSGAGSVTGSWERPALASGVAFAVLLAMGVGGFVVGTVAAAKANSSGSLSSSETPLSDLPTDSPTQSTYPTDDPTYDSYPSDTPTPTLAPEAAFTNQWSATALAPGGYSENVELETGAPEHFTDGMMNGRATAGATCSINSETDAVVPAKLTVTNTSPGNFSSYPAIAVGFGSDWSGAAAEVAYSDGPQCQTSEFNVEWTESVSSGNSVGIDLYFVISNYYTPDHPDGDPQVLADAQVNLTSASDSTDDLTYTPQTPKGPGVDPDSGYFSIASN